MKIYLDINNGVVVDISDIQTTSINEEFEISNIEDFYEQIKNRKLMIDSDLNIEDFLINLYEEESAKTNFLSEYKIKHWVSNRSFGELIDMFEHNEIIVPHMQRNFVWDSIKCSRLIESIIMGLPIPPLFLLEVEDNKYELIDGFQRLTALSNYVNGRQWNYDKATTPKSIPAKLSSSVAPEIANKTFKNLDENYKTKIKRSTIPLIEFRQLDPSNYDSKYLIFERINTGSVKLNPMQIRKSLSYGEFIESLYKKTEKIIELNDIFSPNSMKKDAHIEAVLRVHCFYSYYYKQEFTIKQQGIKNILNKYCEENKKAPIKDDFIGLLRKSLQKLIEAFTKNNVFKRVESDGKTYGGNLNISIMEAMTCAVYYFLENGKQIDINKLRTNYNMKMCEITRNALSKDNPFSVSTGVEESIKSRFDIAKQIVESSLVI